jgi:hypothetical protein
MPESDAARNQRRAHEKELDRLYRERKFDEAGKLLDRWYAESRRMRAGK